MVYGKRRPWSYSLPPGQEFSRDEARRAVAGGSNLIEYRGGDDMQMWRPFTVASPLEAYGLINEGWYRFRVRPEVGAS